ncbi:MAG: type I restriction enzyme HsdR N-terminal domain-containing protein [Rikenellaceae bacterium]
MQRELPKLNFPPIKMRARRSGDAISVWDTLRKSYLLLTPEEWVRQHLNAFLQSHLAVPPLQIALEYPVQLNGQSQRADVVVFDRQGAPTILAECKAPDIKITQSTLDQAVRYNSVLCARYIILTNGLSHHLYEYDNVTKVYCALSSFEEITL